MKKYIAVVEINVNCPRCDPRSFYGLEFFNTLQEVFAFLVAETNSGLFIASLWDGEESKEIENIKIKYFYSHHHVEQIVVLEDRPEAQVKLFECFRHPYNLGEWKISGEVEEI